MNTSSRTSPAPRIDRPSDGAVAFCDEIATRIRAQLREQSITVASLASVIDMNPELLRRRLRRPLSFTCTEVFRVAQGLGLSPEMLYPLPSRNEGRW